LSSIDHVTNGTTILGQCRRFRLVAFRDNDRWVDSSDDSTATDLDQDLGTTLDKNCVASLLSQDLPNHERQAVLAAQKIGEYVLDGNDAVLSGLSKRGVVKTYVMIEGCPKELGCTVILRGSTRKALKQVKKVLRFMINAVSKRR
jgi:1-phosphatidylinositol-3-phosphate 5-kinase